MRDARLMALDLGFPRLQARSNTLTLSRESRLDSFISTIEDKKTWSNEGLGQSLIREILVSRKKTGFCAEVVHRGQPYLILENAFKPIFVPFVPKKSSLFHQI